MTGARRPTRDARVRVGTVGKEGEGADAAISPLVGEMGGSPEGGAIGRYTSGAAADAGGEAGGTAPPSALPGISPQGGRSANRGRG